MALVVPYSMQEGLAGKLTDSLIRPSGVIDIAHPNYETTGRMSARTDLKGQPLVEVLGVRFHSSGEAPTGTVIVYDGKRGQIIYSGGRLDDITSSRQTQVRPAMNVDKKIDFCSD